VCVVCGGADAGRVYVEERRVVVRRDALGDSDAVQTTSVRRAVRRSDRRQLPPCRRHSRLLDAAAADAGPAEHLSARDLRPHARVLATRADRETVVPRDPHVPSAQELRLQSRRRAASLPADHQRRLTADSGGHRPTANRDRRRATSVGRDQRATTEPRRHLTSNSQLTLPDTTQLDDRFASRLAV